MSKIMQFFVLTLVVVSLCRPIAAQGSNELTEEQMRAALELISEETKLLQQELEEARIIRERIIQLRVKRAQNELPQKLERLTAQNDYDSIQKEFDILAEQLDILMVTNPAGADSLHRVISRLFRDFTFLQDNLDYYAAGIAFYQDDDLGAISGLEEFFAIYPTSDVTPQAAILYIKVLLYTGQDQKALEFYARNPDFNTPDVQNLIAHAYYNTGDDAKALAMFRGLHADRKFGDDALLMSRLIVAVNSDEKQALQDFAQLERVYQNDPFLMLAMARMHINVGNWAEAEKYYQQYYTLIAEGREVLSLYEMALSYLNSGKKEEAHTILSELLLRKDTGSIYSTVLYLWSELESEAGRVNNAKQSMQEYIEFVDRISLFIPRKPGVFQKIEGLKQRIYDDPSQESITAIASEMGKIKNEFTQIHEVLISKPSGLSIHLLNRLYSYELSNLSHYLKLFEEYNQANQLRFIPIQSEIDKAEDLHEKFYTFTNQQEQELSVFESRYEKLQVELQRLVEEDPQLNRQLEIKKNIDVYNTVLNQIDILEQRSSHRKEYIDIVRAEYQAKKQEMELLYAYYEYDMTYYDELHTEIELLNEENKKQANTIQEDRQFIDSRRDYLVHQFTTVKPEELANKEMLRVKEKIDSQIAITDQYISELNEIQTRLSGFESDVSFIDLQLAYLDVWHQAKSREQRSTELSFEEAEGMLADINRQRQQLYDRIVTFIEDNPGFSAFEQPSGFGKLIGVSHLYYNLAELHYAMFSTDPQAALVHYRKVLEIDPKFYLRDAVQYNIGFISNYLIRYELDRAIDEYFDLNPEATTRPDNLRYNEQIFRETITAFQDVFDNYKSSPHFEETTYRLGTLFFQIGADAQEPIRFYDTARSYYNVLVGNPNSPYRYEALYQRGWTYLNSNQENFFILALDDFIQLLMAIDESKITDQTEIKNYLHTSIQNIGYCLTAIDGSDFISEAKGAQYVLSNLASYSNLDLIDQMIDEAIKTKIDLQAPMQAIDFMRAKTKLRPLALDSPAQLDSIYITYYRYRNQLRPGTNIDDIRYGIYRDAISRFNRDSDWFKSNMDKPGFNEQLVVIRKAFADIEFRLNADFLKNPTTQTYSDYTRHIQQINTFTEIHDEAYQAWYLSRRENIVAHGEVLARTNNDPIVYINTIRDIYELIPELRGDERVFNYEGLAFKFAKIVHDSLASKAIQESQLKPELKLPASPEALYTWYKAAAQRFMDILISELYRNEQNIKLYSQIMFELASKEFTNNQYKDAENLYMKLLEIKDKLTPIEVRTLYVQLARIAENGKNYDAAEKWYRLAIEFAEDAEDGKVLYSNALYQIQRIVDDAVNAGNFEIAANQYLRLAEEFKTSDPNRSTAYKIEAHKALNKSKQYQSSIDILLQVAAEKTSIQDVYVLYYDAWNIADSQMNDKVLALKLQNEFIEKYPSSNETFRLRVSNIERKAQDPSTKKEAAELYMTLHQDAVAKRIDTKDIPDEQIYLWAIDVIQQSNDEQKLNQMLEGFIGHYPQHSLVIPYMMRIADYSLAQGDTLKSDRIAKEIYIKDKSNFVRFENVAKRRLLKIALEFENAYQNQNWSLAFAKRDEFKKIETEYKKEGLALDFKPLYEEFANAQKAYDAIQARNNFLKKFDTQMTSLEAGFVKRKAADLIAVSSRTTWKNHLIGGKSNHLAAFKKQVNDEVNRVIALLQEGKQFDLDNNRTLRALSHIAVINEFASEVVKTQVDKYIEISREIGEYRNRRNYTQADYDYIVGGIAKLRDDFSREYLNAAYRSYVEIFDNYHLAGFNNSYTERAKTKLESWNAVPSYKVEAYLLNDGWDLSLVSLASKERAIAVKVQGEVISPNGQKLSTVLIPPNHELVIQRSFKARVAPEFAMAHLVYPYDVSIKVNGTNIDAPVYTRIDTLDASRHFLTTQFAVPILQKYWAVGSNQIEMRFPNKSANDLQIHFALKLIYDTRELQAAIPIENVKISTDTRWDVSIFNVQTGLFDPAQAIVADGFNIPLTSIEDLSETKANPIWVPESADTRVNRVMFKRSFVIDTEFKEGYVVFVAPQSATVLLNGHNLGDSFGFMHEPDPLAVFPNMVYFDSSQIVKGRNELQIIVNNASQYRGFLAEVSVKILGKEE